MGEDLIITGIDVGEGHIWRFFLFSFFFPFCFREFHFSVLRSSPRRPWGPSFGDELLLYVDRVKKAKAFQVTVFSRSCINGSFFSFFSTSVWTQPLTILYCVCSSSKQVLRRLTDVLSSASCLIPSSSSCVFSGLFRSTVAGVADPRSRTDNLKAFVHGYGNA